MEAIRTEIEGLIIVEPKLFPDARGWFTETYSQKEFDEKVGIPATGKAVVFVQDNESCSTRGVVRGLHYQRPPYSQSKLVRCTLGRVLDVAVDLREGSPTYGRHLAIELSAENHRQLFIPRGFAHGFAVLSETAVFSYKCDAFYAPQSEGGIQALDPALGIDWQIPNGDMILSDKDRVRACLADCPCDFPATTKLY